MRFSDCVRFISVWRVDLKIPLPDACADIYFEFCRRAIAPAELATVFGYDWVGRLEIDQDRSVCLAGGGVGNPDDCDGAFGAFSWEKDGEETVKR